MKKETEWMYTYRHDGATLIGCRLLDKDCHHDDEWKVDCSKCEHNQKGET